MKNRPFSQIISQGILKPASTRRYGPNKAIMVTHIPFNFQVNRSTNDEVLYKSKMLWKFNKTSNLKAYIFIELTRWLYTIDNIKLTSVTILE